MKKKKKKGNQTTENDIRDAVHEAARQFGWIVPTDEIAVADAESRMASSVKELPLELKELKFPSTENRLVSGKIAPLWDPSELPTPISRAARRGGSISPEVEKIMKHDREEAEKKLHDNFKKSGSAGEQDEG